MTWLKLVWDELLGMFVDDGALALQAAVLIAIVAVCVKGLGLNPLLGGIVLLLGCVVVLGLSLGRKTRKG
ncbi:MAG: hypothetical protein WCS20_07790 [Alphaproteobacteria bacterium]|jgi:hypothetical protein